MRQFDPSRATTVERALPFMLLRQFECDGFRLLRRIQFVPAPGVNIIHGDNAQGKTSLLEAILFLATSRSHRTNNERELVQRGKEGFRLKAQAERRDRTVALEAAMWKGAKRFKVGGVAQNRISDILGQLSLVFFAPEDAAIIKGAAAHRRHFLDMELSQLLPAYLRALQQYRLVLRQRNELLRTGQVDSAELEAWDQQLVRPATAIVNERRQFLEELSLHAERAYTAIAPNEVMRLVYAPSVDSSPEGFLAVLREGRRTDLRNRHTSKGPHRDDFELYIGDIPARQYGSQGQQRTAALALKLAELELIRNRTGEYPLLMLDDVLSELDEGRRRRLLHTIGPEVQCLLTTTDPAWEDSGVAEGAHFQIREGDLVYE